MYLLCICTLYLWSFIMYLHFYQHFLDCSDISVTSTKYVIMTNSIFKTLSFSDQYHFWFEMLLELFWLTVLEISVEVYLMGELMSSDVNQDDRSEKKTRVTKLKGTFGKVQYVFIYAPCPPLTYSCNIQVILKPLQTAGQISLMFSRIILTCQLVHTQWIPPSLLFCFLVILYHPTVNWWCFWIGSIDSHTAFK